MYLAGWLPPDSVTAPLSAEGMTIDDLIADLGPRFPANGQERLTLGLLVVAERALSPTEMAYFDRIIREFSAPTSTLGGLTWTEATNGKSILDPALPPAAPGGSPSRIRRHPAAGGLALPGNPSSGHQGSSSRVPLRTKVRTTVISR
jgi:hypothetical protein